MADVVPSAGNRPLGRFEICKAMSQALELTREHLITVVSALVIGLVVTIFTGGFMFAPVMLALCELCVRIVDCEDGVQSGDIMKSMKPLVVSGFLLMLIPLIGTAACLAGIVIMIPVTEFAVFLRYDNPGVPEGELLKRSWNIILRAGLWRWLFLQLFLLPVISLIGFLGCGIGIFATTALSMMVAACAYRQAVPKACE